MKRFVAAIHAVCFLTVVHAADLYISSSGSDTGDGSRDHPFASLIRARDVSRKLVKDQGVTIWVGAGDYLFGETLSLTSLDSGRPDHPVIWRNIPGEKPRLIGSRSLKTSDFQIVTTPSTLARIPETLRGKIVEIDLGKLGVKNVGPFSDVFHDSGFHAIPDLFHDGTRLPLSRSPKTGYMHFEKVLDNAGGPTDPRNPSTSIKNVDPKGPGGIFVYRQEDAPKFECWKSQLDRGVWLRGYWRVTWEVSGQRLSSIDTTNRTAAFARPIPGGIGNKYTRPAGNGCESYWLTNLLEEISEPGEWCIDFKDHKIYLYPSTPVDAFPYLLADSAEPVISLNAASHIVIQGLEIEANLGDGIRITGGEHDLIAGCTVHHVDRYAVVVDGGKGHVVQSNDLHHLGEGGVWLGGGDEASVPRVAAGHRVVNNHIHDFSELSLVYAPAVNAGFTGGGGGGHHAAVGMYVAHNLIHDTPHGGILYGSMDSVFEFNEIFRWCLVSNDLGAFYAYDSRIHHFGNVTFRYNFMHDSRIGDGIYFDHDHPDMKVIGNIVALHSDGKRGTGYLFKHGSMEMDGVAQAFDCRNNVALDCNIGFEFVTMLPHQGEIANNVAVNCARPFIWRAVDQGKTLLSPSFASGTNLATTNNSGFIDPAALDFRLSDNAPLKSDLPGFQPIPVEKIGLYVDEYRRTLPTEEELDRTGRHHPQDGGLGYDIRDRPQH